MSALTDSADVKNTPTVQRIRKNATIVQLNICYKPKWRQREPYLWWTCENFMSHDWTGWMKMENSMHEYNEEEKNIRFQSSNERNLI